MSARMRSKAPRSASKVAASSSFTASEAKNNFGDVLGLVAEGQTVYITRYNKRRAVVVSAERYAELAGEEEVDLAALTREFDDLVQRLQVPDAAAGVDALFEMSAAELAEAAVRAARRDDG